MKYHRIKCEIYKAEGKTWERMAEELLLSAVRRERVVRLIFFTACKDNQEYRQQRTFLEQWADSHFPSPRPVVSVVAKSLWKVSWCWKYIHYRYRLMRQ